MFDRVFKVARSVISDALAPTARSPLEEFKDTWKHIIDLIVFCEQHDETKVANTTLPECMIRLVEILRAEEELLQGDTGPCMEYLYDKDILKLLIDTGVSNIPEGIQLLTIDMLTKLLASIAQPMLAHRRVFPHLKVLLKECIRLAADPETDDVLCLAMIQLDCAICGKLNDDPNFTDLFVETPEEDAQDGKSMPDFLLLSLATLLLRSSHWETARLAHEAVALCATLGTAAADSYLANSNLCNVLMDGLVALYADLPQSTQTASDTLVDFISSPTSKYPGLSWRDRRGHRLDVKDPIRAAVLFLEELAFIDHLTVSGSDIVAEAVKSTFHTRFLQAVMEAKLTQGSEGAADMVTSYLNLMLEFLRSAHLVEAISRFTLNDTIGPVLIARCDDMSDQLSMTTLLLFLKLLGRYQQHAFDWLITQHCREATDGDPNFTLSARAITDRLAEMVPAHLRTDTSSESSRRYFEDVLHEMQLAEESCASWLDLGKTPPPLVECNSPFLQTLLSRYARVFSQSYAINLLVTAVISRVLQYPSQPVRRFLLGSHKSSLLCSTEKLVQEMITRAARLPSVEDKLKFFRSEMTSGVAPRDDNSMFFLGIILIEEFTKELSAIALIDANEVILA
eukprot:m.89464 g.89464  ORF g.89464 m.89464 type:complete len:624 (-) comp14579_c0_seq1:162-2033(-)